MRSSVTTAGSSASFPDSSIACQAFVRRVYHTAETLRRRGRPSASRIGGAMGTIIDGVVAEFSDLSAVQVAQLAVRLLIAAVLGGLIGRDRERAGKAAGVRTH